jgi:hypothetical protein
MPPKGLYRTSVQNKHTFALDEFYGHSSLEFVVLSDKKGLLFRDKSHVDSLDRVLDGLAFSLSIDLD